MKKEKNGQLEIKKEGKEGKIESRKKEEKQRKGRKEKIHSDKQTFHGKN